VIGRALKPRYFAHGKADRSILAELKSIVFSIVMRFVSTAFPTIQRGRHLGSTPISNSEGRIVQSEAAFKLRDAVTSQSDARTVVLELTEVHAIEGGGLGMLI
jgi:hypothetical protein